MAQSILGIPGNQSITGSGGSTDIIADTVTSTTSTWSSSKIDSEITSSGTSLNPLNVSIIPDITNVRSLGTTLKKMSNVYSENVDSTVVKTGEIRDLTGTSRFDFNTATTIKTNGKIYPNLDGVDDLGDSSKKYRDAYVDTVTVDSIWDPAANKVVDLTTVGDITTSANIIPSLNNTYDVGSNTNRISNVYSTTSKSNYVETTEIRDLGSATLKIDISPTTMTTSGRIQPATTGDDDLGTATKKYRDAYVNTVTTDSIWDSAANMVVDLATIGDIITSGDLVPSVDNTYDIGDELNNKRYRNIFANNRISGTSLEIDDIKDTAGVPRVYVGADPAYMELQTNLNPDLTANQRSLGTFAKQYQDVYCSRACSQNITDSSTDSIVMDISAPSQITTYKGIKPQTNNLHDIGTTSARYKDAYLSGKLNSTNVETSTIKDGSANTKLTLSTAGQIQTTGVIQPSVTATDDIGTPLLKYKDGYFNGFVRVPEIRASELNDLSGNQKIDLSTVGLIYNLVDLQPLTDDSLNIGSNVNRFASINSVASRTDTISNTSLDSKFNLSTTGQINTTNNNLRPSTDGIGSIGTAATRYNNAFLNGYVQCDQTRSNQVNDINGNARLNLVSNISTTGSLVPSVNNVDALGSLTNKYSNAYINGAVNCTTLNTDTLTSTTGQMKLSTTTASQLTLLQSMIPQTTNFCDVGSSANRIKDIYAAGKIEGNTINNAAAQTKFDLSTSGVINTNTQTIRPTTTNTGSLGSSTLHFNNLFCGRINDSMRLVMTNNYGYTNPGVNTRIMVTSVNTTVAPNGSCLAFGQTTGTTPFYIQNISGYDRYFMIHTTFFISNNVKNNLLEVWTNISAALPTADNTQQTSATAGYQNYGRVYNDSTSEIYQISNSGVIFVPNNNYITFWVLTSANSTIVYGNATLNNPPSSSISIHAI